MRTTIQTEEETVTEEVLRLCPDATRWVAGTMEWDDGFYFHNDVAVTTPAGNVTVDLHGTVGADALREMADLVGQLTQDSVHTVVIEENWTPTPPAPHEITLHDDHGTELVLFVDAVDHSGVTKGDLAASNGHLHLKVDGIDVASLFVHRPKPGGPITFSFGVAPDDEGDGDWTPKHTIEATKA